MRSIESPLDKVVRAASPAVLCGGVMDKYLNMVKELRKGGVECSMWRLTLEGEIVELQVSPRRFYSPWWPNKWYQSYGSVDVNS
ncbi:hypothetical protein PIB30_087292 [Stylosanthes scabra]|uniref:Uncharacterized protein n=1 Tax=Stylosanthes scabra TaxID=79078 RepID=A0ABU6ZS27_9FABA|nr:hypothetical protein [Stylosanthes scabra]